MSDTTLRAAIGAHEILYPFNQAYDSVAVKADETSLAAANGRPECAPMAANTSG